MEDKNPLKMKVSDLKAELGRRGLSQTGLKFDLAQRLQTAMDVDEFGVLPSMTSPSHSSSSPLLPVPGNYSTDRSDSPPQCPQTPCCESVQGGPSDEQAQDLDRAAETQGSEVASPMEQSCLGDASIVVDATQSEGGAPPGTEDILATEEEPGGVEKGHDQTKGNSGGSDDKVHDGIGVDDSKLVVDGGSNVEHGATDVGGPIEKTVDAEEYSATATANEESPLLGVGSPQNDKSSGTEEFMQSGENTPQILSDSVDLATAPVSPPKVPEQTAQEDKGRPEVGAEELDGEATQTKGAKPDDSDHKKSGAKGDATAGDANQRNQETTKQQPPGFSPDSLLLASLAERMKDREERFRQGISPDTNEGDKGDAQFKTGNDNRGPAGAASGRGQGGKSDRSCRGSGSGRGSLHSAGDACPQVHEAQTVGDIHKAKLMKRKERFMARPSSGSSSGLSATLRNSSLAKVGTPLAGCSSSKVPSGVLGEEASGPTSSSRQAAREVAVKMARRSERFGVKGAGTGVSREVGLAEFRDPRGSSFAKPEATPGGGKTERSSSPPSGGYSFDPLPRRQKRARATTTPVSVPSYDDHGSPAKQRRGCRGIVGGGLEKTASPDVVEARSNTDKDKAAKATERGHVRFQLPVSNGVDEGTLRRNGKGKPSPPSCSGRQVSLGSAFVLLGVKKPKPAPKLSTTATAAGAGARSLPRRLSRGGDDVNRAGILPPGRLGKQGKTQMQPRQRDRPPGSALSKTSVRHPRRERQVDRELAQQAAKMAERRKRFAEDPRAPSFR